MYLLSAARKALQKQQAAERKLAKAAAGIRNFIPIFHGILISANSDAESSASDSPPRKRSRHGKGKAPATSPDSSSSSGNEVTRVDGWSSQFF